MGAQSRAVQVGGLVMGGGAGVCIQSMTNTDTRDVENTLVQINRLAEAGCEIVRISVYDEACARAVRAIKDGCPIPLVADIHFDYRLAIFAAENGVDKLRINPGNIGNKERVQKVADAARAHQIPIRIGVNMGSLSSQAEKQWGRTPRAMVESALWEVAQLEEAGFDKIVISAKASNVAETVQAYRLLAEQTDYPLHLGVTEAGTLRMGRVKSAIGLGALLLDGIGDTLRVSLTADPVEEVYAAQDILKAVGMRRHGVEIISCPTCGRRTIDVEALALEVENHARHITRPMTVAVMGCAVNGPGEAKSADLGLAGGGEEALLFAKGKLLRKISSDHMLEALLAEMNKMNEDGAS